MKAYKINGSKIPYILVVCRGEWWDSCSSPSMYWIGAWVRPWASLDVLVGRKVLAQANNSGDS